MYFFLVHNSFRGLLRLPSRARPRSDLSAADCRRINHAGDECEPHVIFVVAVQRADEERLKGPQTFRGHTAEQVVDARAHLHGRESDHDYTWKLPRTVAT